MEPVGGKLPIADNVGVETHVLSELRAGSLAHFGLLLPDFIEYRPQHGLFNMAQRKSHKLLITEKQKRRDKKLPPKMSTKPFPGCLPDGALPVEVIVQYAHIAKDLNLIAEEASWIIRGCLIFLSVAVAGHTITEIPCRLCRLIDIEIVVKIDEMLRQSGNTPQAHLYGARVKSRQVFLWHEIGMAYQHQLGMTIVYPVRKLTVGHQKHLMYPRSIPLHGPEPVTEQVPVAESSLILSMRSTTQLPVLLLPLRVVAVEPCDNEIYFIVVM